MSGTIHTDIAVRHAPDELWSTLLRTLHLVTEEPFDDAAPSPQVVLIDDLSSIDGVELGAPVPVTLHTTTRSGSVDLSSIEDVPDGLRAELSIEPTGDGSTLRIGVATDAWWGGTAARVARIGFLRDRLGGDLEARIRDVVTEVVDAAVGADDAALRRLVTEGTPTTRRLADQRRRRLAEEQP